jgi:hypothetical protein
MSISSVFLTVVERSGLSSNTQIFSLIIEIISETEKNPSVIKNTILYNKKHQNNKHDQM